MKTVGTWTEKKSSEAVPGDRFLEYKVQTT